MQLEVTGLPKQPDRGAYYELWLTQERQAGRAVRLVPRARQDDRVRFSVPYGFKGFDGWVVTKQTHGAATPGPVVLTT